MWINDMKMRSFFLIMKVFVVKEDDELEEEDEEEMGYVEIYVEYMLIKLKIGLCYLDVVVEISFLFSVIFFDVWYKIFIFEEIIDNGWLLVL